jgi:hypothetical protein
MCYDAYSEHRCERRWSQPLLMRREINRIKTQCRNTKTLHQWFLGKLGRRRWCCSNHGCPRFRFRFHENVYPYAGKWYCTRSFSHTTSLVSNRATTQGPQAMDWGLWWCVPATSTQPSKWRGPSPCIEPLFRKDFNLPKIKVVGVRAFGDCDANCFTTTRQRWHPIFNFEIQRWYMKFILLFLVTDIGSTVLSFAQHDND